MTDDIKEILKEANDEYEKEKSLTENIALREIMKIEHESYYNKSVSHSRLKSIREILSKYSVMDELK